MQVHDGAVDMHGQHAQGELWRLAGAACKHLLLLQAVVMHVTCVAAGACGTTAVHAKCLCAEVYGSTSQRAGRCVLAVSGLADVG